MIRIGRRKNRRTAPATVAFTSARNAQGHRKMAVYAECQYSGVVAGPFWGHGSATVRACLAGLTQKCDCGRTYHKLTEVQGRPLGAAG